LHKPQNHSAGEFSPALFLYAKSPLLKLSTKRLPCLYERWQCVEKSGRRSETPAERSRRKCKKKTKEKCFCVPK
jgi:hypothetical protein